MKYSAFAKRFIATLALVSVVTATFTGFVQPTVDQDNPSQGIFLELEEADVSPNAPPGGGGTATAPSASNPVSTVLPIFDIAIKSGKTFSLQCTAPAGAKVTATVDGTKYTLSHSKAVKTSTYVVHKRNYSMPSIFGTQDLGTITYSVTYLGKTYTKKSEGNLFAVGSDSTLKVQICNNSATVFNAAANSEKSGYRTVAHSGAIDTVIDYSSNGNMYKLGTGGWIDAKSCTPLTINYAVNNPVASTSFSVSGRTETISLYGSSHPI